MLYGRRKERAQIGALLERARGGQGGVLVVRGEAGIGKHALLADAVEQATGFRMLRTSGVEAEVGLAFAGLQRLLGPVLDRLDRVPSPQAEALRAAFGLVQTRTETNRFLVELGVLSLLGVAAGEQPLLCLISEARWLDAASADALVFVARRLKREPIVLLFAAREGQVRRFVAPGLPELHLRGLDAKAAAELLASRVDPLAPQVRDRLIGESGGNPLALLGLPAPLTSQQLGGQELLPEPLLLTARLQQVFLQRFQGLPQATPPTPAGPTRGAGPGSQGPKDPFGRWWTGQARVTNVDAPDQRWLPHAAAVRPTEAKAFASPRWPANRGG